MLPTLPKIEFDDVTLGYPGHPHVIDSLTHVLEGPGIIRLEGSNGSGKSTLCEAIAGHLPLRLGQIRVCGREAIQGRQESVTFIRTAPALAHSVTMRDHCLLFAGNTREGIQRISELTTALSLRPYLDHVPAQLSSGTQRKFWVALGLLRSTPVLLMDEPFNELDEESCTWLFTQLHTEAATRLVILVCHSWPAQWALGKRSDLTEKLAVTQIPVNAQPFKKVDPT